MNLRETELGRLFLAYEIAQDAWRDAWPADQMKAYEARCAARDAFLARLEIAAYLLAKDEAEKDDMAKRHERGEM